LLLFKNLPEKDEDFPRDFWLNKHQPTNNKQQSMLVKFMKIFRVRFMKFNMQNGENYARSAKN
jgi:hypothetical protein